MSELMLNSYHQIRVMGIASAVSNKWQSLEECVETYGAEEGFKLEKFKKSTGVTGRWCAGDYQTTSDFCFAAAEALIQKYEIDRNDIGVLVLVTQGPDYSIPATACVLHKRLGLSKNCIAFDVNQGCSGFVYGLNIASALLQSSNGKYALMLCGDTSAKSFSRGRREKKKTNSSRFLFGDSGTATLLEKKDNEKLEIASCSDGEGYKAIIHAGNSWRHPWLKMPGTMDDIAVFNFATSEVPEMLNQYMIRKGSSADDYDRLVLHQANLFIMKQIAKKTGFPLDKLALSLDTFANTSSASIPNTLVKEYGGQIDVNPKRFLCCGFGVGLSWAAVELNIAPKDILPLVHTDEYFEDGYPEENPDDPYDKL